MDAIYHDGQLPEPADAHSGWARRAVLRGGAAVWAAPAIVAITAAPSLAVSAGTLAVNPGTTDAEPVDVGGGDVCYDVVAAGVTVTPSAAVAANQLTLTVTYAPRVDDGSNYLYRYAYEPTGWTCAVVGNMAYRTLTYTYTGAVAAGAPYPFPDGSFFGTQFDMDTDTGEGIFTLTFAAPGQTSAGFTVVTPGLTPRRSAGSSAAVTRRRH